MDEDGIQDICSQISREFSTKLYDDIFNKLHSNSASIMIAAMLSVIDAIMKNAIVAASYNGSDEESGYLKNIIRTKKFAAKSIREMRVPDYNELKLKDNKQCN